jgi:hypothetical protein
MLAAVRLLEVEERWGEYIQSIIPLELDGETLRLILHLRGDTHLRVTEKWRDDVLERYSYYWLSADNRLKIGWDNAPHHTHLANFPHHKHVVRREDRQPSFETCLEDVMKVIIPELPE